MQFLSTFPISVLLWSQCIVCSFSQIWITIVYFKWVTQVTRLLQAASQAILLNHVSLLETEVSKCICPVKYRCTCSVKYVSRKVLRGFHSLNTGSKAPVWAAFQYISEILLHIDGKTFFVCSFVTVCVHLLPWFFCNYRCFYMFVFCWFAFGVSKKIIFLWRGAVFINLYFSYSVEDRDVSKKYFVKCQVERINLFCCLGHQVHCWNDTYWDFLIQRNFCQCWN